MIFYDVETGVIIFIFARTGAQFERRAVLF
jgi:hypothetical protein